MNESFVVTGGAGFIGSNLVAALNARGHDNLIIVDHLDDPGKEANLGRLKYTEYIDRDDFRARLRAGAVTPVTTVFHLGACSSTTETDESYLQDNNVAYTRELCLWSLANKVRFIYASSAATYGDGSRGYADDHALIRELEPLNLYGQSKQDVDLWALHEGLLDRIVGLKYFNVYGPGENHKGYMRSVVHKAHGDILEKGALGLFKSYRPEFGDGEQVRDFVYVRDAVAVTLFFHDHPERSGLFNCGTGHARSWVDLGKAIFAAMDREPRIHFVEMPETMRDKYQYHTEADTQKLRAAGYTAPFMTIEEGVADYVRNHLAMAS